MKKAVFRLCMISIAGLFLLITAFVLICATQTGTALAVRMAACFLPNHFSANLVQGRLMDSLQLEQVVVKAGHVRFSANKIHLNWHALSLLNKKLIIHSIEVFDAVLAIQEDQTTTRSTPQSPNQHKNSLFRLPAMQIDRLQLTHFKIVYGERPPLQLQNLTASVLNDKAIIAADIHANLSSQPLSSHLSIQGTPGAYQWQFSLHSPQTHWLVNGTGNQYGVSLHTAKSHIFNGQLAAEGKLDWSPMPKWDLTLRSTAVNLTSLHRNAPTHLSFLLHTQGDMQGFALKIDNLQGMLNKAALRGHLNLQAHVDEKLTQSLSDISAWRFTVASVIQWGNAFIHLRGNLADSWQLNYGLASQDLTRLPLGLAGNINLKGDITGAYAAPRLSAQLVLDGVKSLQQPDISLQGKILMHAWGSFQPGMASMTTEVLLKEAQLSYKGADISLFFPLSGAVKVDADNARLKAHAKLELRHQDFINAALVLADYRFPGQIWLNQPLQANIHARLNQTQLGELNLPWVEKIKASLAADLQVNGTLADPRVEGDIVLNSSQLYVRPLNLSLKNVNLSAKLQQDVASYSGSVEAGQGKLQLAGKTFKQAEQFNSSIKISGKQFLVSNTPQYHVYLSPAVSISSQADGWHVQGNVVVPKADIKLADSRSVVTMPTETIIIQSSGKIASINSWPIWSEVMLELGDQVHLQSSGLNSSLTGKIMIRDYPNSETRANGTLGIKGYYELQGQKLSLEEGTILFINSPIDNPGLNVRAVKEIHYKPTAQVITQEQNLLVGIQATGTLENPNLRLFSDPASWSQPDILSLIVLGQPASMASSANVQLLTAALKTIMPKGSNSGFNQLISQMQQMFGLSDFGLESTLSGEGELATKTTSFALGKYVSPRLYLSYSLGILNAMNTLRLRYSLSQHWSLQSQANTAGSGVDVLYSIEH